MSAAKYPESLGPLVVFGCAVEMLLELLNVNEKRYSLCSKLVIRCNRETLAKRREALLWFGYHTRETK